SATASKLSSASFVNAAPRSAAARSRCWPDTQKDSAIPIASAASAQNQAGAPGEGGCGCAWGCGGGCRPSPDRSESLAGPKEIPPCLPPNGRSYIGNT